MKKIFLGCAFTALLAVVVLFVWNSQRELLINHKAKIQIEKALSAGILAVAEEAPRGYSKENDAYYPIIGPLTASPEQKTELYDLVLVNVNQDENTPVIKITGVDLNDDLGYISASATTQHVNLFGLTKTKSYSASEPVPAFVSTTGLEKK